MTDHEPQSLNLLTIPEAARLLSVHPRTVKNWIKTGSMPIVRVNDGPQGRRIAEADLREWIEARKS